MSQKTINELLEIVQKERERTPFVPQTLQRTKDGTILLDPQNKSDRDWFENAEFDDLVNASREGLTHD